MSMIIVKTKTSKKAFNDFLDQFVDNHTKELSQGIDLRELFIKELDKAFEIQIKEE